MFNLQPVDLKKNILGCGDGPADFNRTLHEQGGKCVSLDPLYRFSAQQIQRRIDDTFQQVMAQTRANREQFLWTHIPSVDALGELRMNAMRRFLEDYFRGKQEGRYVAGALPALPFVSNSFDLALSSHFLFLYSGHLSAEFHIAAISEMLRVATEVRIFPILDLNAQTSPHVDTVINHFQSRGYQARLERVGYEFQQGGHTQLVVRPSDTKAAIK